MRNLLASFICLASALFLDTVARAQLPDAVTTKTAAKILDYGLPGAIIVIQVAAIYFLGKALLACLNASIERQAGLTTVIIEQKVAGEKVADALEGLTRRLETQERALEALRATVERRP